MTALTDDRKTQQMEGIEVALPVGASKEIFAGGLVVLDGTTGYAEAGADAATKIFAGVAREHVNNTGAAGDKTVQVQRHGIFQFNKASAAQADVGQKAYILDDQTVGLAADATNDILCGVIVSIESSTKVWVDIYKGLTA